MKRRHPTILKSPLFTALGFMSFENGRQTDIQAIPAHMARGRLSSDIASIELDTIKVSLIYHFVRDEVILNSENKFLKVRW